MRDIRLLMGMPITVEIVDAGARKEDLDRVYEYFGYIDRKFSTYKKNSEITKINTGLLNQSEWSPDMRTVMALSEETLKATGGYFNIRRPDGTLDPSGLVKGWAIRNAAESLRRAGFKNYYIEAGGDIQVSGNNSENGTWTIGIRNPFNKSEIVKILFIENRGVATSGTYVRGQHIYNPFKNSDPLTDIVSLTVIGPDVYEADRFATAAFAMGKKGIEFIERLPDFSGYMIDSSGMATFTSSFDSYTSKHAEAHR